jgi:hypothetical protein
MLQRRDAGSPVAAMIDTTIPEIQTQFGNFSQISLSASRVWDKTGSCELEHCCSAHASDHHQLTPFAQWVSVKQLKKCQVHADPRFAESISSKTPDTIPR